MVTILVGIPYGDNTATLVMTLDNTDTWQKFVGQREFTMLLLLIIVFVIFVMTSALLKSLSAQLWQDAKKLDLFEAMAEGPDQELVDEAKSELLPMIKSVVKWPESSPNGQWDLAQKQIQMRKACTYIEQASAGKNVVSYLVSRTLSGRSFWVLTYYNRKVQALYRIVLFIHFSFIFANPTPRELERDGLPLWSAAIQLCFVVIETGMLLLRLVVEQKWLPHCAKTWGFKPTGLVHQVLYADISPKLNYASIFVALLVWLDWFGMVLQRYTLEYTFPVKVWMFLAYEAPVLHMCSMFLRTLVKVGSVGVLFMTMICVSASIAFSMFAGTINSHRYDNNFESYFESIVTLIAFYLGAENFSDTMYSTFRTEQLLSVYWIIMTVVGLFFLMAMILAIFQQEFSEMREKAQQKKTCIKRMGMLSAFLMVDLDEGGDLDKEEYAGLLARLAEQSKNQSMGGTVQRLFNCTTCLTRENSTQSASTINAAMEDFERVVRTRSKSQIADSIRRGSQANVFATLDGSSSDLSATAVEALDSGVQVLVQGKQLSKPVSKSSFDISDSKRNQLEIEEPEKQPEPEPGEITDSIDSIEFIKSAEDSHARFSRLTPVDKYLFGINLRQAIEKKEFESFRLVTAAMQIFIASLYPTTLQPGLLSDEKLDSVLTMFTLYFFLEVHTVVFIYGRQQYFMYGRYFPDTTFRIFAHYTEFIVVWAAVLVLLLGWRITGCATIMFTDCSFSANPKFRIAFALAAMRLITIIPSSRKLLMILISILPEFWPMFQLLLLFINCFGLLGMQMVDSWEGVPEELGTPEGNFGDILHTFIILFEMLVGNNWSNTMYAASYKYGKVMVWYFVMYVIIVALLFTNLFIGVILDAFTAFYEFEKSARKVSRKAIAMRSDPETVSWEVTLARRRNLA